MKHKIVNNLKNGTAGKKTILRFEPGMAPREISEAEYQQVLNAPCPEGKRNLYFDLGKDVPPEPTVDNSPILWVEKKGKKSEAILAGETFWIHGLEKTGKSSIIGAIVAAALREEGDPLLETLMFRAAPCPKGKRVVHVDTRSSESEYENLMNTTMRRTKYKDGRPEHLHSYQFRPIPVEERLGTLEKILFGPELPPVHVLLVDPLDDLVSDHSQESVERVANLMRAWANMLNTVLVVVTCYKPNYKP